MPQAGLSGEHSRAAAAAVTAAADAGPGPIAQRTAKQVTADALPTVQIDNGVVWSQVIVGNTVYAGGEFSNTRPAGAAGGTQLTPRGNLLAYNIRTGRLVTSFAPSLNAQVLAVAASPDGSRIYVGGDFTTADGTTRNRIAAYSTATGALIASFAPSVNASVDAITATDSTVYVGGAFGQADGTDRSHLAAFRAADGALTGWAPTADGQVHALVLSPDRSRVIVGGSFARLDGAAAVGMGAIDATNGSALPWAANQIIRDSGKGSAILSLSTDGDAIYGTGYGYNGTGNFEGAFSAVPDSGQLNWLEDCHGDSYGVSSSGAAVYVVSHEHFCSNIGSFPDSNPRVIFYHSTAFTVGATGHALHNSATGTDYGDFYGQPTPSQFNWYPKFVDGKFTGQNQAAWSVASNATYVVEGGEFPSVNGTPQYGLVRFAVGAVAPDLRGPQVGGAAQPLRASAVTTTGVRLRWRANWDPDDENLTYSIYRDGQNSPVFRTTAVSQVWNRPNMSWVDTGLSPGTSHAYHLSVSDPDGNTQRSANVTVAVPRSAPLDDYARDVLNLDPSHYWRLGQAGGSAASTDIGGTADLAYGAGVTTGASGAIIGDTDTAATFSGTSTGTSGTTQLELAPNNFTVGAWFRTTSTSGGLIVGFGDASTGTSANYDRHLYLDNNGHLVFGVYSLGFHVIQTTRTYNDGSWHQVVGSLSGDGMVLYVDGKRVGTDSATAGQPFSGYWRVGGDNLSGWPAAPSSNFLAGTIDEVAVYPSAVSFADVRAQYADSGRSVDIAPVPTDRYGKAVYADSPELYYRLDDSSGPAAADASADNEPGAYSGGISYRQPSTVTGPNGTGAGFDGVSATLASSESVNDPTVYSEEAWFNTTTDSGGMITGFGSAQSGLSGNYDRLVYLTDAGTLMFGANNGSPNTIGSSASYNDGRWHQVVATQGPTGMRLYVDGSLVASSAQSGAQNFTGYWRVGGDNLTGWPSQPTSNYFNGTLDEVAIYTDVLTAAQVSAHYQASYAAPNTSPTASFTSSCANLSCSFDGTGSSDPDGSIAAYAWRFGDGAASSAARPTHSFAAAGTYPVSLTVTDDDGATDQVTKRVTVSAPAPAELASDKFNRTVRAGWGRAGTGGSWTLTGGTTNFAVGSGSGTVRLARPGASPTAYLNAVSATGVNFLIDSSVSRVTTGNGVGVSLVAHHSRAGDYRLALRYLPHGSLRLILSRFSGGTVTNLASATLRSLTYQAGQAFRIRFVVTAAGNGATSLAGSAWRVAGSEPKHPQVTATDATGALRGAGSIGVVPMLASNATTAPVTVRLDNVSATRP